MIRRARLVAVLATLAVGAMGVISSTQTWLTVVLDDGAQRELAVSGAAALPVLTPLSLAVLALGAALSIVGQVLRYVFAALALAIAGTLGYLSAQIAVSPPVSAVASTVTTATGITGTDAVAALLAQVTVTAWPVITVACSAVLLGAGILVLATARSWGRGGRKYESEPASPGTPRTDAAASRPHDAIDSWDDLSRGEDPTADPRG